VLAVRIDGWGKRDAMLTPRPGGPGERGGGLARRAHADPEAHLVLDSMPHDYHPREHARPGPRFTSCAEKKSAPARALVGGLPGRVRIFVCGFCATGYRPDFESFPATETSGSPAFHAQFPKGPTNRTHCQDRSLHYVSRGSGPPGLESQIGEAGFGFYSDPQSHGSAAITQLKIVHQQRWLRSSVTISNKS